MILGNIKGKAENFGEVFYPAKNNYGKSKKPIDNSYLAEYTYSMKNQKEQKAKRPSKKVLMAEIEAKGVDKTIVQSLSRANIDTMIWVKSLLD